MTKSNGKHYAVTEKENPCSNIYGSTFQIIKKVILAIIIIATLVVLVTNKDTYSAQSVYEQDKAHEYEALAIAGEHQLEQHFIARKDHLATAEVRLYTKDKKKLHGTIHVTITDADGNIVGTGKHKADKITRTKKTDFTKFNVEADLTPGQEYVLSVTTSNGNPKDDLGVYSGEMTSDRQRELYTGLYLDGSKLKNQDMRIRYTYSFFPQQRYLLLLGMLILALVIVIAPVDGLSDMLVEKQLNRKRGPVKYPLDIARWIGRFLFLAAPLACYVILSQFYGTTYGEMLRRITDTLAGKINILIFLTVLWIVYAIVNRTTIASFLTVAAFSFFGFASYFVELFRGSPAVYSDLFSLGTAQEVAGDYSYALDMNAIFALVYAVAFCTIALSLRSRKGWNWKARILVILVAAILAGCFRYVFFSKSYLDDHDLNVNIFVVSEKYEQMGSAFGFCLTWAYSTVEKPEGYSVEAVQAIADKYPSDSAADSGKDAPNVIVIMNEALADLSIDGDIPTNEDWMPYIHSLKKNTVKGNCHVSVFGGRTANTEFECLTGASMAFLPEGSVPYNTMIRTELPGMTTTLKQQGYGGMLAFHPYKGEGWKRETVYPLLGFEDFISVEDLDKSQIEYTRAANESDSMNYKVLEQKYEEYKASGAKGPFYLFNVTMQNHSGYDGTKQGVVENSTLHITDPELQDGQAELYLNLVQRSDSAFKELTDYFSSVDEKTVIVMFGDHQPGVHSAFWDKLYGRPVDELSDADAANRFVTPFIMWANYDIEEESGVEISSNYIGPYLLDKIGAQMTGYQKYLLELHKELPYFTAVYYQGEDGELHKTGEESKYSDRIREYQTLQYNLLADTKNTVSEFFNLK